MGGAGTTRDVLAVRWPPYGARLPRSRVWVRHAVHTATGRGSRRATVLPLL